MVRIDYLQDLNKQTADLTRKAVCEIVLGEFDGIKEVITTLHFERVLDEGQRAILREVLDYLARRCQSIKKLE